MKSVRLRLLILALLPLIVVLPILLGVAMVRWADKFDDLLIAKVASDLRIAEQYLQRIMATRGEDVRALAQSARFRDADLAGPDHMGTYLAQSRKKLGLDFLYLADGRTVPETGPHARLAGQALTAGQATAIDLYSGKELARLDSRLAERARLSLIATEAAVPTKKVTEDRGMVLHTAARVEIGQSGRVLIGGILLNRNLDFIDTINNLVYRRTDQAEGRAGTATLFLEDVRVSTNVRLFENVRALGTRVSAVVRKAVLDDGKTWLDRAFVVNDWYISGYLPIEDSRANPIGMLYVGFLEEPFRAIKNTTFLALTSAFVLVVGLSVPLFLWLARGIFSPLERMTRTMERVEAGDLKARIGKVGTRDEIGQVAGHLDTLLDQVQERDRALRNWASELNDRVTRRTAELHEANQELETTFQRLVMSEKLASIGEITAGVAHEINNPVAVIQGNLDVIRMTLGGREADVQTEMQLIDEQIHRINVIVGKLLQFARPDDYSDFAELVQIAQVMEDCLVLVQNSLMKSDIAIERQFSAVPGVRMNRSELQQVIINLMINASQAIREAGVVDGVISLTVHSRQHKGQDGVEALIADNGPGIAPDRLDQIFDPFHTTKPGKGTGLGLSISQTLIQRAGGLISVSSEEACGSCFSIWLPVADNLSDHVAPER